MSSHYCYQHELIGIEVRGVYDGILIWQCQGCRKMWPRFTEGKRYRVASELIEQWEGANTEGAGGTGKDHPPRPLDGGAE